MAFHFAKRRYDAKFNVAEIGAVNGDFFRIFGIHIFQVMASLLNLV